MQHDRVVAIWNRLEDAALGGGGPVQQGQTGLTDLQATHGRVTAAAKRPGMDLATSGRTGHVVREWMRRAASSPARRATPPTGTSFRHQLR